MRGSTALRAAAALLLLLAALAASNVSVIWYGKRSEEAETRRMFRDWMADNKKYSSVDEEEHRYAVFKENRRRFDKNNAAADAGFVRGYLGLNVFADLTDEELGSLHNGCAHSGIEADHLNLAEDKKELPSVD